MSLPKYRNQFIVIFLLNKRCQIVIGILFSFYVQLPRIVLSSYLHLQNVHAMVPQSVAKIANGYKLFYLCYESLQGVAIFVTAQCIYNLLLQLASVIAIFSKLATKCFEFGEPLLHVTLCVSLQCIYIMYYLAVPSLADDDLGRHRRRPTTP